MLDIGCGTGLLSMLAATSGAEKVYGCELYEPLAHIAREVTQLNCKNKIKVGVPINTCICMHRGPIDSGRWLATTEMHTNLQLGVCNVELAVDFTARAKGSSWKSRGDFSFLFVCLIFKPFLWRATTGLPLEANAQVPSCRLRLLSDHRQEKHGLVGWGWQRPSPTSGHVRQRGERTPVHSPRLVFDETL